MEPGWLLAIGQAVSPFFSGWVRNWGVGMGV